MTGNVLTNATFPANGASVRQAGQTRQQTARKSAALIVIGASTGGPEALSIVLKSIGRISAPIVVAMHTGGRFAELLANTADRQTAGRVIVARDGERMESGSIYFAPGDHHLMIEKTGPGFTVRLKKANEDGEMKPSIDRLFESAAQAAGNGVVGVVLSGMSGDGVKGATAVAQAGGQIVVQDSETSAVWGMPSAVAGLGIAKAVLPPPCIALFIRERGGVMLGGETASD